MGKPNDLQVEQALQIMRHHMKTYGAVGGENSQRRLVFAMLSVLTGEGEVADEYKEAAKLSVINDPNEKSKAQLSDNRNPDGSHVTGDPEAGGSSARRAVTGPGASGAALNAEAVTAGAHRAGGAVTPDESSQQLPGGGDRPVYPAGRPRATTEIQSWPPSAADLPKYTRRELIPLLVDELIDYAIPAGIENPERMSHEELVEAVYNAAFGKKAKPRDADEDVPDQMPATPAGGDEQTVRENDQVEEGEAPALATERVKKEEAEADSDDDTEEESEGDDDAETEGDGEETDETSEEGMAYDEQELSGKTKAELKEIAGEFDIEVHGTATKQDIIDAIMEEQRS